VIAGIRGEDGRSLVDARQMIREGQSPSVLPGSNTVIGVIATNASLTQAEATRVARMAHDGLARTISPSHTPFDGDTMFALATGELEGPANVLTIGALAADVVAEAILRGVRAAEGLDGLPSVADLQEE